MSRQVLVYDADLDCMVNKYGRNYHDTSEKRADHLGSPAVHAGGMQAIKSMADGRWYETRRNYYRSVSRAGCEIVGPDKGWEQHIKAPDPTGTKEYEADLVQDIKAATEIEQSKVPSYGPEARRLMRKQRRQERAAKV